MLQNGTRSHIIVKLVQGVTEQVQKQLVREWPNAFCVEAKNSIITDYGVACCREGFSNRWICVTLAVRRMATREKRNKKEF